MDTNRLTRVDATTWRIEPHGTMRVPAVIYADENLIRDMDDKRRVGCAFRLASRGMPRDIDRLAPQRVACSSAPSILTSKRANNMRRTAIS